MSISNRATTDFWLHRFAVRTVRLTIPFLATSLFNASSRPAMAETAVVSQYYASDQGDAIDHWIEAIDDDRDLVRRAAVQRIRGSAIEWDVTTCEQIIQRLLRKGLTAELQTQAIIERLIADIREITFRSNVRRVVDTNAPSELEERGPDQPLIRQWKSFSRLAGDGADTRAVFIEVAEQVGPLTWSPDQALSIASTSSRAGFLSRMGRVDLETQIELIGHLGYVTSGNAIFYSPRADSLLGSIHAMTSYEGWSFSASPEYRVLCRLIDRTLLENTHGWSAQQRLGLGLHCQRREAVNTICKGIFETEFPASNDLAFALLASCRIGMTPGQHGVNDSRMLIIPGESRVSDRIRFPARNMKLHRSEGDGFDRSSGTTGETGWHRVTVRPRVRDVAAYVKMVSTGIDPRERGMLLLQADPVWGVRVGSIGFPE